MTKERVLTGIIGFDEITGGFEKGGSYLLSGAAGTGKTVFSLQFLKKGLLHEEKALLVTEQEPISYLNAAKELDLPLDHYIERSDLVIIKQVTQTTGIINDKNEFANFITDLGNLVVPVEATRIVFDSMIPIVSLFGEDYFEEGLRSFLFELKQMNLTLLLTTRMPTSRKTLAIKRLIEDQMRGSVHLDEHTKEDQDVSRKLVVRKFSTLESPYPVFTFNITPGIGIEILEKSKTGLAVVKERESVAVDRQGFSFSETYKAAQKREDQIKQPEPRREEQIPQRKVSFTDNLKEAPQEKRVENPKRERFDEAGLPEKNREKTKEKSKISFTDYTK